VSCHRQTVRETQTTAKPSTGWYAASTLLMCGKRSPRAIYTHYTPHGAARLDRMYLTKPEKPEEGSRKSNGGIHRSPGGMIAYKPKFPFTTTTVEPMGDGHLCSE
jgi:hypothetical protein